MTHKLTREEWNKRYEERMRERTGWTIEEVAGLADADDTPYNDGDEPEAAADEELTNWD